MDLGGEVDFNTLRWLSRSLGHNRDNQNYSIFPTTTSFPQEASSFRKLCRSALQLGCAAAWITPQSLLQLQGCKPSEQFQTSYSSPNKNKGLVCINNNCILSDWRHRDVKENIHFLRFFTLNRKAKTPQAGKRESSCHRTEAKRHLLADQNSEISPVLAAIWTCIHSQTLAHGWYLG